MIVEALTKLYINIKSGEISIEGSEDFVSRQIDNIEDIVSLIQSDLPQNTIPSNGEETVEATDPTVVESTDIISKSNGELTVPDVFGEWLQMFNDDITGQDKALITAYYVQQDSEHKDFKTAQINKSLKDHGIKLANTSSTLKEIESKKLIFQTRKVGKLSFKRVSEGGVKYLKTILR